MSATESGAAGAGLDVGVLTSLYPSGVRPLEGVFAERRWQGMAARGHRVRVVQPTPRVPWPLASLAPRRFGDLARRPAREEREGIVVERPRYTHVTGLGARSAAAFARVGLDALLAGGRPDVVVCDYAWPAAEVVPLCRAAGLPVVLSGRGSDVLAVAEDPRLRPRLAAHLAGASGFVAVSEDLLAAMGDLAAEGGCLAGEQRAALVANGVDADLFRPVDDVARMALRADLGWAPDEVVVLVVGHLIQRKDPLLALSAFRQFLKLLHHAATTEWQRPTPPARLVFVGEGELEAKLREAADELTAGPRPTPAPFAVDLQPAICPERLAERYAAADLLLLCSSREGRPNVVLEALATGLPVVATRAGGTPELLDGTRLRCVNSRYPTDLAKLMLLYVDRRPDPGRLRERVAPLTWDASLSALEAMLREVAT